MASVGKAIIKPLMRSLGDTPVHIRQLAVMFRKHRGKHKDNETQTRDMDRADVPEALQDGWGQSDWTPNDVVGAGKGHRPDPSEYLDQSYIDNHLEQFRDGASRIYGSETLHRYGPGQADGSTFVFPTSELQTILDESGGDVVEVATRLGLDPNTFIGSDGLPVDLEIRHFDPSELTGLRMPSGNEAGANPHWIPGGYLPTGIPEAVIDVPKTATGWNSDYNIGLWPGTAQGFPGQK